MTQSNSNADVQRIAELLAEFRMLSKAGSAEQDKRDQILDELQDAVGLAGKMVMEADIMRRAEKLLAGAAGS